MFSAIAIFKIRLACELGRHLGIGLSEWVHLGDKAEAANVFSDSSKITEAADLIADGNWMWAVARGVENDRPFKIYSYATDRNGKWFFDTQVGEERCEPSFGLDIPHLFVPLWSIFARVYVECKKLLGISERGKTGEDV
jgi:hypothetical protein